MAIPTTPRLFLREMTAADLDDMAALLGDEEVMRYYPRPKTREEAQAWIDWNQRLYRDHGFGLWVMVLRTTGEFAGDSSQKVAEKIGLRREKHAHVFGGEAVIYAGGV